MMIACISTHCNLTGDGAKTFIILFAALLQELEHLCLDCSLLCESIQGERQKEKYCAVKQISQFLMMIQARTLDQIMTQDLEKHFLSVFSVCDGKINRDTMESVLEAYFCGKVVSNRQNFLSELSCNFFYKVTAGKRKSSEALCLVDDCFAELHITVTGLPVSRSRILDGLVLHRDFTVYCRVDGDQRVLIVTEPIQFVLSDVDVDVVITAESQYRTSDLWITKRTEAIIEHMRENNIKVLLSSVKQEEIVHYYAKMNGISTVECLSLEEISLIGRITGISPFRPSWDSIHSEITEATVANFCQPLWLGARRYVHISFTTTHILRPNCLVLCGPVHGVTEQHACAFHGAFKMLRHLFTAVPLTESCELKSEDQSFAKAVPYYPRYSDALKVPTSDKLPRPCGAVAEMNSVVPLSVGKELACSHTQLHKPCCVSLPFADLQPEAKHSLLTENEGALVDVLMLSPTYKFAEGTLAVDENELLEKKQHLYATVEDCGNSRHVLEQLQASKANCPRQCNGASPKYNQNNETHIQNNSNFSIKAGSLVPVGGIFEILLHYYLSAYAKQCRSPSISILCRLISDVLLSVPKALCRTQKRTAFPQLYLQVTSALRNNQQLLTNPTSLESVSCKYQLVVSVLHCASRLISIDLVINTKRLPQRVEESDSEGDV